MVSIKKFLLVNIFLASVSLMYGAETVFVPENSLLFKEEGEQNWTVKTAARQDFVCEVLKKEKVFLQRGKAVGFYADVYHLKIPGSDGLCYFPEIVFRQRKDGVFMPHAGKNDLLMFLGTLIFVFGLAAAAGYFRLKPEWQKFLLPAALVFFFWGYALWYIGFVSDSVLTPSDDIQYFNIAKKLMSWDFTSMKYRYTIGFPILCIPFILLFHLRDFMEFFTVYMNFQTFVLIPGLFLLLYRFFHAKMGLSRIRSFAILLLWQILMVFYLPMTGKNSPTVEYIPELYFSNASFYLAGENLFLSFFQLTWLGRNALSDYAACFLAVLLLYVSMKKSRSLIRFFVLSMGFGFLCLVRINYIFFAPLLAYVLYDSFSGLWKNKINYLHAALCGTAGFMIVFVWQFVLNKIQFGSPFVWPYSLHCFAPDRGFVWSVVPYGFKFLCHANYVYVILGISSLLFIPERKTRVLLTLWIFPMLLFFCGYPIVFNSPTRFIFALYAPLTAAAVMNPVWTAAWNVRIKAALVVFCLCVLCKSDIFFTYFQPWNLEKSGISNTVFFIVQCVVFLFCCAVVFSMRREIKAGYADTIPHVRFLILFTAVFFLGSLCSYAVGIFVLAAFGCGLRDTWLSIRELRGKIPGPGSAG